MFKKYILPILIGFIFLFSVTRVIAVSDYLSIKIEQPKSPTNNSSFSVNFVSLDILNRVVTVKCYKKGPGDTGFSTYGSDINLVAGGGSNNCPADTIVSSEGTYQFYVSATADTDIVNSSTVSVDYKTSGPGTPTDYSKDKTNSCDYKIHFKTADDSGKTVKVEIYRSDLTSFLADGGSRIASIPLGSNIVKDFVNSVPDCNKNYYFAVRAFDSAGNGSSIIGDSFTTTITDQTTTSTQTTSQTVTTENAPGAVLVSAEGETITEEAPPPESEISPTETNEEIIEVSTTPEVLGAETGLPFWQKPIFIIGSIFAVLFLSILFWKFKK